MAGKKAAPDTPVLPPLTVARFEQALEMIERLVDSETDLFVGRMHAYRERQRSGSARRLTAEEAASVVAGLAGSLGADADLIAETEAVQQSDLRAVDEPAPTEVLLAAGVATAPAAMRAGLRLLALLELPADEFEAAYEAGSLDAAVDNRMKDLRALDIEDARARAAFAFDTLAVKAGAGSGEGVRLLVRAMWQALNQAAEQMTPTITSGLSSLTDSPERTDGPTGMSSTVFAGSAP